MEMKNKITVKDVEATLRNMLETFIVKNGNYGNSFEISLDKYGMIAALTRISDKFNRAENLILNNKNGTTDESLYDTLIDTANYCVMTAVYMKNANHEKYMNTLRGESDDEENNQG